MNYLRLDVNHGLYLANNTYLHSHDLQINCTTLSTLREQLPRLFAMSKSFFSKVWFFHIAALNQICETL